MEIEKTRRAWDGAGVDRGGDLAKRAWVPAGKLLHCGRRSPASHVRADDLPTGVVKLRVLEKDGTGPAVRNCQTDGHQHQEEQVPHWRSFRVEMICDASEMTAR